MRAWTFQDTRQKHGAKTPWSVGWFDPEGRKRSKRIGSKSMAEKFRRKKEGELAAGVCRSGPEQVSWEKFRSEYEETVMPKWRSEHSRYLAGRSFDLFEKLIAPKYVSRVDEKALDTFVAKRLKMRGKKKGDTVSAETVKKELRTIRAALTYAVRWRYLAIVPAKPEVDGYGKDKLFVTEKHFDAIMRHCNAARLPQDLNCSPTDFWQVLLATAWVTGMRRSALLAILWDDVDLEAGIIVSRYRENKAKRDQRHQIGPICRDFAAAALYPATVGVASLPLEPRYEESRPGFAPNPEGSGDPFALRRGTRAHLGLPLLRVSLVSIRTRHVQFRPGC